MVLRLKRWVGQWGRGKWEREAGWVGGWGERLGIFWPAAVSAYTHRRPHETAAPAALEGEAPVTMSVSACTEKRPQETIAAPAAFIGESVADMHALAYIHKR